jgi:hypothetical protein
MGPAEIDGGTAAQLAVERHHWEEAVVTFRTWNSVEQALKKQIITVFEPMLDLLTPLPETYLNTYFCLMAASLQ